MSIRFLESVADNDNSVLQQIDDGAQMNYQITCKKDGALFGCALSNTARVISIASGLLIVHGFRFRITDQTSIYTLSNAEYPASNTTYYLYLRITRSGSSSTYEFILSSSSSTANKTSIEKVDGVFDYKIAQLTLGPSGIVGTARSLIGSIPVPGAGSSGSPGIGISLPEPRIELVNRASSGNGGIAANAYLCLANKDEYAGYGNYKVKFVIYRFVDRGRYRNRKNGSKLYVEKTGFVKPLRLGWDSSSLVKLTYNLSDLYTQSIDTSGSYTYRRTDIIFKVKSLIDKTFYWKDSGTKTVVDATTALSAIRSIRSKYNRHGDPRHNFVKIAFKAELWDSTGKKVTESGLSRSLTIVVNRSAATKLSRTYSELFRVIID